MTISGSRKRCPSCGKSMQRWGSHPSGKKRWHCGDCKTNSTRLREDNRLKRRLSSFVGWLTTKVSLNDVARDEHVSLRTVVRRFDPFWSRPPRPLPVGYVRTLVLDATSILPRRCMLLIAGDSDSNRPVSWSPAARESYGSWSTFLLPLRQEGLAPSVVVCDAQRGLLKAIHEVWPDVLVQRCLIHVVRQSRVWLTRRPKTKAGWELLALVHDLVDIRTKRQKRKWIRAFRRWCRKYDRFLKDRSYGFGKRWWYTHRKLRGVRSLLRNAIPDLFRFVTDPTVPRTSNHVEGGCNSRIKELIRCHRGISLTKKLALASWYLALRQGQKPTLNVH